MAFRNVIISNRCKLEYSLNYLICRKGNEDVKILLDEIKLLVINSTQVAITSSLICKLSEKKIKVMFCNEYHEPECEMVPYQNNFYSYRKIKEQIDFVKVNNGLLWMYIVKEKIKNQANNLLLVKKQEQYNMLITYHNDVQIGDTTNREGHSAKVYFNALFGKSFSRDQDNFINKHLNYGYAILASTISREIKSLGYLTELGIHHIGESNSFNLTYDLIEPLRALVDQYVILDLVNEENYKEEFVNMLSKEVTYNNQRVILDNAIHQYITDMINYLKTGELDYIRFIEYGI